MHQHPPALPTAWPLVGRDAELERIAAARRDPSSPAVVILAGAGAGKSRLARVACEAAEADGALVAWVQATRSAAAVPLAAFAGLLGEDAQPQDTLQVMRGCAEALAERAAGRPVILGVDDAQLLDSVSAALVLHLAVTGTAFLVITVRTGEPVPRAVAALWKDAGAQRLALEALTGAAIDELVERVLGGPVSQEALAWLRDISLGNALYLHELLVGSLAEGVLHEEDGLWRLAGRPALSPSLAELVAQRLGGLSDAARAPLELLGLGEPLAFAELTALEPEDALADAEASGLVTVAGQQVRLAHPLYGEVVRERLPRLRGRALRLRLAETLAARTPRTADDALRQTRLLLDAGVPLSIGLRLEAARAANRSGDAELGEELAARAWEAEPSLPAARELARARTLRGHAADAEAVLAAAEPLAPDHPEAAEYVMQRMWVLWWGLRDRAATDALYTRAGAWREDPAWTAELARQHAGFRVMSDGFNATETTTAAAADATPDAVQGRGHLALQSMTEVFDGDGVEAARLARRCRPPLPLEGPSDLGALGACWFAAVETGEDVPEAEAFMVRTLRDAVRLSDHEAAGIAALTVAALHHLRGRDADAGRWLAEAELHFGLRDVLGSMLHVHAYRTAMAGARNDPDAARAELAAAEAVIVGEPLPTQLPYLLRARGWSASVVAGRRAAGEQLLRDTAQLAGRPLLSAQLGYEAMRVGAPGAPGVVLEHAQGARCALVDAYADHARARATGDGPALLDAAERFAAITLNRYAMEAAAEAAAVLVAEGRMDSARRAAARARELHVPGQEVPVPAVDGLDGAASELTAREAQLAELAAKGLTNAEIADRLVLSVRTVEAHLYRAMQKLGLNDRRELRGRTLR